MRQFTSLLLLPSVYLNATYLQYFMEFHVQSFIIYYCYENPNVHDKPTNGGRTHWIPSVKKKHIGIARFIVRYLRIHN